MCTVAFVPLPGGGYLLGHNRDERRGRAPGEPPSVLDLRGCRALAPRDPEAGGTWIALNGAGVTVCILNAAERGPQRLPRTPRSRGLLVRDLACTPSLASARAHLEGAADVLASTRAFHLVVVEPGARVGRFRWDGVETAWEETENPALFVSSLLQPLEVESERSAGWRARMARGSLDRDALAAFLSAHEPERGPRSVCMHREDAGTVSRTLVEVSAEGSAMHYQPGPPCTPSGPEAHFPWATGWRG